MADQEKMKELKQKRRQRKGVVTRHSNKVSQYVVEELPTELSETLDKLKDSFRSFEQVHNEYHELLKDEDEIDTSDTYYYEVQKAYVEAYKLAKDWLKSYGSNLKQLDTNIDSKSRDSERDHGELLSLLNMPKVDFEKFSGDPLKYHTFIAMFDESVKAVNDKGMKLTRLLQCTSDRANDAIRACALMKSDEGYDHACKVLKDRFGNDYLVSENLIQSICHGKQLKTPEDLLRFSDELKHCQMILKGMNKLNELESQKCIVEISDRLQNYLKVRWRRKAIEIKDAKERYPFFSEFVEFVEKEARQATDPVYGSHKHADIQKHADSSMSSKYRSSTSFSSGATRSDSKESTCILCSQNHKLFWCTQFKNMKPIERLQFAKSKNLCKNCLLANHTTANCRKPTVCSVPGCGQKHTKFLHLSNRNDNSSLSAAQSANVNNLELVNANVSLGETVHMPVVGAKVNGKRDVCALLDSASSNTFCTRALVDSLGVEGRATTYSLNTLSTSNQEVHSEYVNLQLASLDGLSVLNVSNVYVVDKIPIKSTCVNVKQFAHFAGLQFVAANQDVHLLIGQDNSEALIPLEIKKGNKGEPFATRTIFGWSINGPSKLRGGGISSSVISHFISSVELSLDEKVDRLWAIENESVDQTCESLSQDDKRVLELWDRELKLTNGHYELPIPFKDGVHIPNNFSMAVRRLDSLKAMLSKKGLMDRYKFEMDKLFQKGYAELVPVTEIPSAKETWYLPHHPVIADNKPGKLRIVFDCAAKYLGESLNDKCLRGPDNNNRLIHVLLRFRQDDFAVTGDIESMFYQVRVPVEQRNALRFLWYDENGCLIHCRMTCHVFGGVWCSSSTTFALRQTLKDFDASPLVANAVMRSFYVDDMLQSVPTAQEASEVFHGVKTLLGKVGFNLTKFVLNDSGLLEMVLPEDRAKEVKEFDSDWSSKVLGIKWNVGSDVLGFQVKVDLNMQVTRRSMLSTIASTYDPLGLVSPLIVPGKMLFQDATRLRLSWDDAVPPDIARRWINWMKSLSEVVHVQIPRCVKPDSFDDAVFELHHFSDASERALGCCSYLRCLNKHGEIFTALLFSKSKLAPLKMISIPRLELQAAVMATEVDTMLRNQLDLDLLESHFWVDSELVLKYICNETRRFKVYVGNRVSAIRAVTKPSQWHHINGSENIADVISRGSDIWSLDVLSWLEGPKFLRTHKSQWQISECCEVISPDDPELKRDVVHVSPTCFLANVSDLPLDRLIEYHSDWFKLKKAVAWLLRLKAILRKSPHASGRLLTLSEISAAEVVILSYVQSRRFADELVQLGRHGNVGKSSAIRQLAPFINEAGLVCVGGRLGRLPSDGICKYPVILPHDHKISSLIADHYHNLAHLGTEWVVSLIRCRFWLTRVRIVVKRVKRNCVKCRRLFADPCHQRMADLPADRVEPGNPPFTSVATDCFGAFFVKLGRSKVKRYGCIFTCMATRAVHLEKLDSLDTDSFINALRRFISRRGQPRRIFSDNGTNFVGGKSELDRSLRQLNNDTVSQFCLKEGVEWVFNPPMAPHMGGTWERMIRTIKRVMSGVMNTGCRLTDEILETLFCEIEAIVNSRPITKLSEDITDPAPLTPNHLLLLRDNTGMPLGVFHDSDIYKRRWRVVQVLADQFWRRWLHEYVPELQRRNKWLHPQPNLKVGDLVLIKDENTPRGVWPMGLVIKVKTSTDGLVRSVVVKTKSSEFSRPVTKCVLLEGCHDIVNE